MHTDIDTLREQKAGEAQWAQEIAREREALTYKQIHEQLQGIAITVGATFSLGVQFPTTSSRESSKLFAALDAASFLARQAMVVLQASQSWMEMNEYASTQPLSKLLKISHYGFETALTMLEMGEALYCHLTWIRTL